MRAMVLTGFGGYDKREYRRDVPVPGPAAGEVLIQVTAGAVNNTDIWTREGAYGADEQAGWQGTVFSSRAFKAPTSLAGSSRWAAEFRSSAWGSA